MDGDEWTAVAAWVAILVAIGGVLLSDQRQRQALRQEARVLQAQTFLFYIERIEQTRAARQRLRRAWRDGAAPGEEAPSLGSVERWAGEYRAFVALERTDPEAAAASLWAGADSIARAYDLLGAAYGSKVVDVEMVDLMYLPVLADFWDTWLAAFTQAERDRRHDERHLHSMQSLVPHAVRTRAQLDARAARRGPAWGDSGPSTPPSVADAWA